MPSITETRQHVAKIVAVWSKLFASVSFNALPMTTTRPPTNNCDFYLSETFSESANSADGLPGRGRDVKESDCDVVVDVDSDTSTNSSDEFDWDEEPSGAEEETHQGKHARRGRALWLAFMKLTRLVRTLLVGIIGTALLITPLLVVDLKYHSSGARSQVHTWSLWLSIIWATSCATYLIVDLLPDTIVTVILLLGGQVERLKTQVEVCHYFLRHQGHFLIMSI